jgi:ferredoxin
VRIKLDRTVCDGFGVCGLHAPEVFSLDEWGYATLVDRSGAVPARSEAQVRKALASCPVHAITTLDAASSPPR